MGHAGILRNGSTAPSRRQPPVRDGAVRTIRPRGDENQCVGIAEALGLSYETRRIPDGRPLTWMAPWGPIDPRDAPGRAGGLGAASAGGSLGAGRAVCRFAGAGFSRRTVAGRGRAGAGRAPPRPSEPSARPVRSSRRAVSRFASSSSTSRATEPSGPTRARRAAGCDRGRPAAPPCARSRPGSSPRASSTGGGGR